MTRGIKYYDTTDTDYLLGFVQEIRGMCANGIYFSHDGCSQLFGYKMINEKILANSRFFIAIAVKTKNRNTCMTAVKISYDFLQHWQSVNQLYIFIRGYLIHNLSCSSTTATTINIKQ